MNNYQSKAVVWGQTFVNFFLASLATRPAAALLPTGKIRLSTDPSFAPGPTTALSALVANEANYSGYTAGGIAVVLTSGLNISPSIQGAVCAGLFVAASASPFVPNTVTGYWIDDGVEMVVAERFAGGAQAQFASVGDFLDLTAVLPLPLYQPAA